MLKVLNPSAIGVSGRQSEIIELALTYGFSGLELDLADLQKRIDLAAVAQTRRLYESARLKLPSFQVPLQLGAAEPQYRQQLTELEKLAQFAAQLGATSAWNLLEPANDERPYYDNFETHRKRLPEVCDLLGKHGIRFGLGIRAAAAHRRDKAFQFIYQPDQLLTLVKTAGVSTLGVVVDTWEWQVGGGSWDLIKSLSAAQVVALRLADLPNEVDPATITEEQRLTPTCHPDLVAAMSAWAEGGFAGPLLATPHANALAGMKRDVAVRTVSQALDELRKAAGLNPSGAPATAATH